MAQILGKLFKQFVEEKLVNTLADSKGFQKAAVNLVKASESAQQVVGAGIKDPAKVKELGSSLFAALQNEVKRDLNKFTGQPGVKKMN